VGLIVQYPARGAEDAISPGKFEWVGCHKRLSRRDELKAQGGTAQEQALRARSLLVVLDQIGAQKSGVARVAVQNSRQEPKLVCLEIPSSFVSDWQATARSRCCRNSNDAARWCLGWMDGWMDGDGWQLAS
jgi:hypothetical protein